MSYRENNSFEKRVEETRIIKSKYPNRIPILVESPDLKLRKNKFLIPNDLSVGEFLLCLRKYLSKNESQGIFLFIGEKSKVYSNQLLFSEIIKEPNVLGSDGFLSCIIKIENVFGNFRPQ